MADIATLQTKLDTRLSRLDAAYRASMDAALAHLRDSGMASRAKGVGDRASDFSLADRDGRSVTLSEMLGEGPVVLSFFRGEWCSFCRLEIEALLAARADIVALGASLLMVSPQGPSDGLVEQAQTAEKLTVLKDPLNGVGLQYGLIFRMPDVLRHALLAVGVDLSHIYGTDAWLLPIPATYVIDRRGVITLAHIDPDFTRRLEPRAILSALSRLSRRAAATI